MNPTQPPQPPHGQGPIDPRSAFSPPPPPGTSPAAQPGFHPQSGPPGSAPGSPPPGTPEMYPPPPGMMPPMHPGMFYPPPPPQRPQRTFTRAIFLTLASTIFGISLLANLYLVAYAGLFSGRSAPQTTLAKGDPTQKIAVIPISGMIMNDSALRFDRMLTRAEADANVRAVIVEIDSPGGSITASDEIHNRITRFRQARADVPVVTSMGALATSGGYYIACATDHILARPTTMTGNIGVFMMRFNFSELMERWGIEDTTIASTGATFKTAGSMFKPEDEGERAYLQQLVDAAFVQFKDVVISGRQEKLTQPIDEVANGKVFTAGEAQDLGLVDGIGYTTDALAQAAAMAGLTNHTAVRYLDPPTLRDLLRADGGVSLDRGITINGINLNADASQLQELLTPRIMYLWRGD